jgi:hypothetical protein
MADSENRNQTSRGEDGGQKSSRELTFEELSELRRKRNLGNENGIVENVLFLARFTFVDKTSPIFEFQIQTRCDKE